MLPPKVGPIWWGRASARLENRVLERVKTESDVLASAPPKGRRKRGTLGLNLAENSVLASAPPKTLECSPQTIAEAIDIGCKSGKVRERVGQGWTTRGRSAGAARPRCCAAAPAEPKTATKQEIPLSHPEPWSSGAARPGPGRSCALDSG